MPKLSTALGLLVTLLLVVYAAAMAAYVIPFYQELMYGLGVSFGLPARLSFAVGQNGIIVGMITAAVLVGLWRAWKRGDAIVGGAVLNGANLVLIAYIVLQSGVFVDFAINAPARFTTRPPAVSAPPGR